MPAKIPEFEVVIRPLWATQTLAGEIGNRISPALIRLEQAAGAAGVDFGAF
jgi:hypothetical protein